MIFFLLLPFFVARSYAEPKRPFDSGQDGEVDGGACFTQPELSHQLNLPI